MGLFFDTVFPAVGHVLCGVLQLLAGLVVFGAIAVLFLDPEAFGPKGTVAPASDVRSAAEKSDDNNKKETLSRVETATTTTTSAPELVNATQPEIPEPKDPRELQLTECQKSLIQWERRLRLAEDELDRKEAANDRIRKQLERQLNEAHETHMWVDRKEQEVLLARLANLEHDLQVAVDRNSVYERQMTAERSRFGEKVKKVGKEARQRNRNLVRQANEEKGTASFKVKILESQLETATTTISDLREEARIAKEQCEHLKGACEEHCQAAAERRWKWATQPDKDRDIPIRGYSLEEDAEVLLTGALIEFERMKGEAFRTSIRWIKVREAFLAKIREIKRTWHRETATLREQIRSLKQALDAATIDTI